MYCKIQSDCKDINQKSKIHYFVKRYKTQKVVFSLLSLYVLIAFAACRQAATVAFPNQVQCEEMNKQAKLMVCNTLQKWRQSCLIDSMNSCWRS